jgi:hypothetical protein
LPTRLLRLRVSVIMAVAAVTTAAALVPENAGAIPAFARKYRMSCTTCHAPVPRLKEYGNDFAANGFRLEGKEPKRFYPDTGDDLLTLQRELPIAIRFDAYFLYEYEKESTRTDFQTPFGLKLLSGGSIAKNIGYYLYFFMSEKGEIAGVEDAYIHFNDLFGVDFDMLVGQFQVCDPLFKRELRLTYADYDIYKVRVGSTVTDLTYDRGLTFTFGTSAGFDAVFEVVNGNGKGEAAGEYLDEDNWKNFFLRISQSLGSVRVGGFGYSCNTKVNTVSGMAENAHWYAGVDGTLDWTDKLQLNAQYLWREDENPWLQTVGATKVETRGGFAELILAPQGENGRHWIILLYNYIDSQQKDLDLNSGTLSYSWLLRRNLRLTAEGTYNDTQETYRFTGGFVSAF